MAAKRGDNSERTLVIRKAKSGRSLNRGLICNAFLQFIWDLDYWPLNRDWPLNR